MKATKKQIEKGKSLAKSLKIDIVYVNDKGEYFTNENLAQLSVKGDKQRYQALNYSTSVDATAESEELAEIKSLKTVYEVQAILDTELESEGREEIIKACEDRIAELNK